MSNPKSVSPPLLLRIPGVISPASLRSVNVALCQISVSPGNKTIIFTVNLSCAYIVNCRIRTSSFSNVAFSPADARDFVFAGVTLATPPPLRCASPYLI